MRPIEPRQRWSQRQLQLVTISEPNLPRKQLALLLYALLPGAEGRVCSACKKHDASGPFQKCIYGKDYANHGCLCCLWSGTEKNCTFRKGKLASALSLSQWPANTKQSTTGSRNRS